MNPQNLLAIAISISIAFSGFLAYNKVSGWGWFLFIALMLGFVLADMVGH